MVDVPEIVEQQFYMILTVRRAIRVSQMQIIDKIVQSQSRSCWRYHSTVPGTSMLSRSTSVPEVHAEVEIHHVEQGCEEPEVANLQRERDAMSSHSAASASGPDRSREIAATERQHTCRSLS